MSHSFKIILTEDLDSVLKKVASYITSGGGTFSGTSEQGIFHGKTAAGNIRGEYQSIAGNEIMITITDKPFIVPHSMIETEIKKYFG